MATYKGIRGFNIKSLSSDPSNLNEGEMWYNSTSGTLKVAETLAASWSSGGTIPQIVRGGGSGGTKTAAWLAGGLQYPGDTKNKSWTYNGTSWTAAPTIPNNYFIGGSTGPDSAGLLFDGIASGYGPGTATYEWNGSAWTAGGEIPAAGPGGNSYTSGAGTQTAALAIGGIGDPPPTRVTRVLDYNGSSWTTGTSTPAATYGAAADGPNAATWMGGGSGTPTQPTNSFEWDSSSWTTSGTIGTALPQGIQAQGWGPQTAGIIAGGTASAPTSTISQLYDGATWSVGASMTTPRINNAQSSQSAGTQTGFVVGAYPPAIDATENFDAAAVAVQTITVS